MTRRSTVRLLTAVCLSALGATVAVFLGRPDAAVIVSPWAVLLAIGLSGARRPAATGSVSTDRARVLAGENITLTATVTGTSGWVETSCRPDIGFWSTGFANPESGSENADSEPDDAAGKPVGVPAELLTDEPEVLALADVADLDHPTVLTHTLTASAWGSHDVGRVDLTVHEPYGLLSWSGTLHTRSDIRVHPHPVDLQQLLMPWLVRRLTGAHPSRTIGRGIEYADIRQFGSGDSLRDINWRVSARSDELWVSQRHPDRSTDVVLLLDTFTESGHDVRAVLGRAIEAAVTLAESHLAVNDRVGVIEVGGIIRWIGLGSGRHQLHRLTDALLATRLYENAADRPLTAIPQRALPPRSFIVALSPLLDERFNDTILTLRGSGHDVSVIEYPPLSDESRRQRSETQTSKMALRIWDAEREMTRDRLIQHGIVVGQWHQDRHLDEVLADITNRRRGIRAVSGR